ncbi:MAG: putative membrane protein [Pseudohongiellaceae bacterium]|jgi:putative membrane protein
MIYSLLGTLHLIAIFALVGAIVIENIATKPTITKEDIINLARVDAAAGISAILTLGFGLALWFGVGKPAEFYTSNPIFHGKLGLFALLVVFGAYPANFFFKQRSTQADTIDVPKSVRVFLKIELLIVFIIPLLAFLMARGIGLPS